MLTSFDTIKSRKEIIGISKVKISTTETSAPKDIIDNVFNDLSRGTGRLGRLEDNWRQAGRDGGEKLERSWREAGEKLERRWREAGEKPERSWR